MQNSFGSTWKAALILAVEGKLDVAVEKSLGHYQSGNIKKRIAMARGIDSMTVAKKTVQESERLVSAWPESSRMYNALYDCDFSTDRRQSWPRRFSI